MVVLNPTTGAILAMVSSPTYDPNGYANPSVAAEQAYNFGENVKDHEGFTGTTPLATQKPFPPGSTFKVVVSTAVYNLKPSLINYSFPVALSVPFPTARRSPMTAGPVAARWWSCCRCPATRATPNWVSSCGVRS